MFSKRTRTELLSVVVIFATGGGLRGQSGQPGVVHDAAGLPQEIVWEMVLELKQLAGDTEIKKE